MGLLLALFCGFLQPQDAQMEELLREYEEGIEALREIASDDRADREDRAQAVGMLLEAGAIEEFEARRLLERIEGRPGEPARPGEEPSRQTKKRREKIPDTPLRRGEGLREEPLERLVEEPAHRLPSAHRAPEKPAGKTFGEKKTFFTLGNVILGVATAGLVVLFLMLKRRG